MFSVFLLFRYYRVDLHLNNSLSPLPKYDLCQLWLQLARFSKRSWNSKSLTDRRTDRWTPVGRRVIRKAHTSFQLRWAKTMSFQIFHQPMLFVYGIDNITSDLGLAVEWSQPSSNLYQRVRSQALFHLCYGPRNSSVFSIKYMKVSAKQTSVWVCFCFVFFVFCFFFLRSESRNRTFGQTFSWGGGGYCFVPAWSFLFSAIWRLSPLPVTWQI
jgi:hypothetical protein